MKQFGLFMIALLMGVSLLAQSVIKDANAEKRDVSGFHSIKIGTGIALLLNQGDTEAVAVSASTTEDREKIVTKVEGGVLHIYYDNKTKEGWGKRKNIQLKAYVSIKEIRGIDAHSGASVAVDGSLKADKLELDLSSGAVLKGKVDTKILDVDQSSGSVITLGGNTGSLSVDQSSGSQFNGFDLSIDAATIDSGSGARTEVTVNKSIVAHASSGADIIYKGAASNVSIRKNAGGSVRKKD